MGSVAEIAPGSRSDNNKASKVRTTIPSCDTPDIELVVLPTGRVVAADSEEGLAFKASKEEHDTETIAIQAPRPRTPPEEDKVHKVWADLGLSKRAWPPPEASQYHRNG